MQPEKVYVFDTTLRDGEQAAGTRLGRREKLSIARQLSHLRVDIIEAGYPNSSPEDFEAVQLLAREIEGPVICALSRAVPVDIEAVSGRLPGGQRRESGGRGLRRAGATEQVHVRLQSAYDHARAARRQGMAVR